MRNWCFTLAYNLPEEVEKVTKLLYKQNDPDTFFHLIVDLGFPLARPDEIPDCFEDAREINTRKLLDIAEDYGSDYVKLPNIGVSQNWTQVIRYLRPEDDDVFIGVDPDEHPLHDNWVKAMGDMARHKGTGLVSLISPDQIPGLSLYKARLETALGYNVAYPPDNTFCWGLIGIRGKMFKAIGEIPYPDKARRYGWIETALAPKIRKSGYTWCFIYDYHFNHTVWEGKSVLQDWKFHIVRHPGDQMSFETYLTERKEGKI